MLHSSMLHSVKLCFNRVLRTSMKLSRDGAKRDGSDIIGFAGACFSAGCVKRSGRGEGVNNDSYSIVGVIG